MTDAYYLKKMKEDFSRRTRVNSSYSLRAYARFLGLHPSTLSQVLLGNRPLPVKNAPVVLDKLKLNAGERTQFTRSLTAAKGKLDQLTIVDTESHLVDEAAFQVIAEWEHYAVFTLFDCEDFDPSLEQIQARLKITKTRAEVVIANLIKYGLLKRDAKGRLEKSYARITTSEDIASPALKASHRETLELGKQKLDEISLELRDFSSMMVALDLKKIPEAKVVIREFRKKLLKLMEDGEKTDVYQIAIQFYPLTRSQETK